MSNDDVKPTVSPEEPVEPGKPAAARKRAPARKAAGPDASAVEAEQAPPGDAATAAPAKKPSTRRKSSTTRGAAETVPSSAEPPADDSASAGPTGTPSAAATRRGRHRAGSMESTEGAGTTPAADVSTGAAASAEPATAKRPRRATSTAKEVQPEPIATPSDEPEPTPSAATPSEGPPSAAGAEAPAAGAPEPELPPAERATVHPLTPAADAPPTEKGQPKPKAATEPPTEAARAEPAAAEPAAEPTSTPALPEIPPSSKGERKEYRGSGRRVVVAEDEALIRLDVVETLTEAGFDVVGEAGDGERAVALATELRPDVVVMDIKMPVLDGISAAERIGKARIAPVVLLTAFSQAELVERARDAGAMAYVVKPFTPAELLPAIEIAVARHQEITALESEVADLAERFETRKRVERAKGLLMTKMGLTEPESFRWIQKTSMDRRLTMREVADAVIEQVGGGADKNR